MKSNAQWIQWSLRFNSLPMFEDNCDPYSGWASTGDSEAMQGCDLLQWFLSSEHPQLTARSHQAATYCSGMSCIMTRDRNIRSGRSSSGSVMPQCLLLIHIGVANSIFSFFLFFSSNKPELVAGIEAQLRVMGTQHSLTLTGWSPSWLPPRITFWSDWYCWCYVVKL